MKWVDVIGFEKTYEINRSGMLRNKRTGKIKKVSTSKKGYNFVMMYKDKPYFMRLHRLIAVHFIPNPDNKPHINHKNGVKTDNRICNLEWVSQFENMRHAWVNGYHDPKKKLTKQDVDNIRSSILKGRELAVIYKISVSHIYGIKNKRYWKHI